MIIVILIPFFLILFTYLRYVIKNNLVEKIKYKALLTIGMLLLLNEIILKTYDIYTHQYYKMWLGDMCQMVAVLSIVGIIFKWERLMRIISTWAIIGAVATFCSGHFKFNYIDYVWAVESCIIHMLIFVFAVFTILFNYKSFKNSDIYYSIAFGLSYICLYVLPMGVILSHYFGNIFKFYSTALFKWSINTPGSDYNFFKDLKMPYPMPTILFYILAISVNSLMIGQILKAQRYDLKEIIWGKLEMQMEQNHYFH